MHDRRPNRQLSECQSPRLQIPLKNGNLEAMRAALSEGASPEGSIYNFFPPFNTAAASGQSEAVRLLLDTGAQINRVERF